MEENRLIDMPPHLAVNEHYNATGFENFGMLECETKVGS